MKMKLTAVIVMLILANALCSQHINLVSESLPSLGKPVTFCQYQGYGLFVGGTHHLAILDFNDPFGMPIAVFDIPENNNKSYDLLCYGSHAYLFLGRSMFIISLQDILHPTIVREIDLASTRKGLIIQDSVLYLATSLGSLTSYDLSNPEFPTNMDTIEVGSDYLLYLSAGDGFMVCQGDSLYIVDISDPYNLQLSATLAHTDSHPDYRNSQVTAFGQYLICNSLNVLKVYDLGNPYSPSLISSTILDCNDLFGRTHIHDNVLWSFCYEGTEEEGETGLMAIDLSNPYSPAIYRQSLQENWFFSDREALRASGNRMVFLSNYYWIPGIQSAVLSGSSYAVSDIFLNFWSIGPIVANDDWIAGLNRTINILDYQNDTSLSPIKQIEAEFEYANVMQLKDDLLLCAYQYTDDENTDKTYAPALDIYNLQTGSKLSTFPFPGVPWLENYVLYSHAIVIYNDNALLCNDLGGLVCVDLSDPAKPSQRFRICENPYSVLSAAVHGNELWLGTYVDNMGAYLRCYDISDFDNPVFKYAISLSGIYPNKMLSIGDYLYILGGNLLKCLLMGPEGILEQSAFYVNVSDMKYLLPIGKGLLLGGDRRMYVLSVKDPLHPVQIGSQQLDMVAGMFPWDPPHYPTAWYAINKTNILVGNGTSLKCFDASLATVMCEANLDIDREALQIFPNPSRDKIYVGFNAAAAGSATLEIFNLRGQKVVSRHLNSVEEGLNLQSFSFVDGHGSRLGAGIYMLRVRCAGRTQVAKLVVLP